MRKEKIEAYINLALAEVGFLAGLSQMVGGGIICVKSRISSCKKYDIPNFIQGANNIYENGYYVIFMRNTTGSVRDAYHYVANKLGVSNDTADLVYGAVDLGLTTGNYTKLTLLAREKSWSLFRHIRSDFIRGWKEVGITGFLADTSGGFATLYQMYHIINKPSATQENVQGEK
ncbi:DUF4225 domain-containing protein [Mangrovibacter yixingensis]|uniref:DUF4225 domain-containing protein n=1 Tax=Mangrovibacter yixingensis TaxID=1529639 RepID=UPI001CFAA194|nr:DUF4225 domain-containing protein [Mangrovibacter yixingensis]